MTRGWDGPVGLLAFDRVIDQLFVLWTLQFPCSSHSAAVVVYLQLSLCCCCCFLAALTLLLLLFPCSSHSAAVVVYFLLPALTLLLLLFPCSSHCVVAVVSINSYSSHSTGAQNRRFSTHCRGGCSQFRYGCVLRGAFPLPRNMPSQAAVDRIGPKCWTRQVQMERLAALFLVSRCCEYTFSL